MKEAITLVLLYVFYALLRFLYFFVRSVKRSFEPETVDVTFVRKGRRMTYTYKKRRPSFKH